MALINIGSFTDSYASPAKFKMPKAVGYFSGIYGKISSATAVNRHTGIAGTFSSFNSYGGKYAQATLNAAANGFPQTVVSVEGSGTITHILPPQPASTSRIDVLVTVDDIVYQYVFPSVPRSYGVAIGGVLQGRGTAAFNTAGENISFGYGTYKDQGSQVSTGTNVLVVNQFQALEMGVGIPYERSFKVEIIMEDLYVSNMGEWQKGYVAYVTD